MRRAAEVCPESTSRLVPAKAEDAYLTGNSSRMRADGSKKTSANQHTMPNPIAAPDSRWEISLDTRKQPHYTLRCLKQYLINKSNTLSTLAAACCLRPPSMQCSPLLHLQPITAWAMELVQPPTAAPSITILG